MTDDITDLLRHACSKAVEAIQKIEAHPKGPPASEEERKYAGEACVRICKGNPDKARTLWKLITERLGYMPHAAAIALMYASSTSNLVPDIPEPDLDGPRGPAADGKEIS